MTLPTRLQKIRNALALSCLSILLGAAGGAFTWAFFYFMAIGLDFVWHSLPKLLHASGASLALYPLIVCSIGGLVIGIYQKYIGPYPEDLNTVVATIKEKGSFPHNHVWQSFFGALLPLLFGGSIGPEAGLTGVVAAICSAIGERLKLGKTRLQEVASSQTAAIISAIYGAPLFGFFGSIAGYTDNASLQPESESPVVFPRRQKVVLYFLAIASALGALMLLGSLFGGGLVMPRFSHITLNSQTVFSLAPTIAIGACFGWLFHASEAFIRLTTRMLKEATITKALIAGVVLGALGCVLPFVMFAGEDQVATLNQTWMALGPLILLLTGLLKVFATPLCLSLGWRGGHFFPLIFAGIATGYGCALLFHGDAICLVTAATAALMGAVMQKPLFTVFLLFLCFPAEAALIMILAAAIGAAIPLPKHWQQQT